jgi:hypothetical protein
MKEKQKAPLPLVGIEHGAYLRRRSKSLLKLPLAR